jgi:hypothetical protein
MHEDEVRGEKIKAGEAHLSVPKVRISESLSRVHSQLEPAAYAAAWI